MERIKIVIIFFACIFLCCGQCIQCCLVDLKKTTCLVCDLKPNRDDYFYVKDGAVYCITVPRAHEKGSKYARMASKMRNPFLKEVYFHMDDDDYNFDSLSRLFHNPLRKNHAVYKDDALRVISRLKPILNYYLQNQEKYEGRYLGEYKQDLLEVRDLSSRRHFDVTFWDDLFAIIDCKFFLKCSKYMDKVKRLRTFIKIFEDYVDSCLLSSDDSSSEESPSSEEYFSSEEDVLSDEDFLDKEGTQCQNS